MDEETIDGDYSLLELPPVTHFEELAPIWEIRADESSLWFERFLIFLNMGAGRTVMGAYRIYCDQYNHKPKPYPPQKWYKESQASEWELRSRAYDQYMRAMDRQADLEARADARAIRREMLAKVKDKLNKVIDDWEPDVDVLDWATVTNTLKTLLEQSRNEFGDTEPSKHLAVNVHANGARAFEDAVKQVYGEE